MSTIETTKQSKQNKAPRMTTAQRDVMTVIETLGGSATEEQLRTASADVRAANSLVKKSILIKEDGPTYRKAESQAQPSDASPEVHAEGAIEGAEGAETIEIEVRTVEAPALAPKAETAPRECLCGCGALVTSKRSRFAPGHDSKLHAMVRRIERGEATLDDIPSRKDTRDYLITAPWMTKHAGVLAQLQGHPAPVVQCDPAPAAPEPAAPEPAAEPIQA